VTTLTPDLPALVRRQWDREPDAFHPLVWAEWLEERGQTDRGELVRLEFEEQNSECDCERGKLIRELRAGLSAWKCPECWGKGIVRLADYPPVNYRSVREATVATPSFTIREEDCARCRGTGDSLTGRNADAWFQYPLTWDCGFPRWATLPTLWEAVRPGDTPARSFLDIAAPESAPTPRLRALAQTPPWGVPLDGVRAGDREPYHNAAGCYLWHNAAHVPDHGVRPGSLLPEPVFLTLGGDVDVRNRGFWRTYRTGQAAADAFARGLVKFARGYKG
jgi:uncharacterized protein (TIGR02996 family)